jgi:hypothetical protein
MTERPDPFRSVACDLLCVLVEAGRPMSLRELESCEALDRDDAVRQLSVARVAGFVRRVRVPGRSPEPSYQPTALGAMIARRTTRQRAAAAATAA